MGKENIYKLSKEHRLADKSMRPEMEELLIHAKKISDKLVQLHRELPEQEIIAEMRETEALLNAISQKWVTEILYLLFIRGTQGYNELKNDLGVISSRTLSDKLKMLVKNGYVKRKLFDEHPPRVEYSLSEKGKTVARLLVPLVYYLLFIHEE